MDLTHRFSVPAGVAEAWNAFNDVEQLALCFPGATVTSVGGDEFGGQLKIKLGPSTLVYDGSGRYLERNETERRMVIEASGEDRRRNGSAAVTVSASFTENREQTDVAVLTNLEITGKPAQFGEEVIADVAEKLLDQFASCLSRRFAEGLGAQGLPVASGAAASAAVIAQPVMTAAVGAGSAAAGFDEADTEQTIELEAVPAVEEVTATAPVAEVTAPRAEPAPPTAPKVSDSLRSTPQRETRESTLDVLSTVVPVLLKRYGPALAVVGLLLFIVIKIIRRKS